MCVCVFLYPRSHSIMPLRSTVPLIVVTIVVNHLFGPQLGVLMPCPCMRGAAESEGTQQRVVSGQDGLLFETMFFFSLQYNNYRTYLSLATRRHWLAGWLAGCQFLLLHEDPPPPPSRLLVSPCVIIINGRQKGKFSTTARPAYLDTDTVSSRACLSRHRPRGPLPKHLLYTSFNIKTKKVSLLHAY